MIVDLLLGDFIPWIVGAAVALAGFWGYGRAKQKQGADAAKSQAKEADYERADEIRDRFEHDFPDSVRKYDDAGWRDDATDKDGS